eukprot:scaffold10934_cov71-Phaeocystis_antarctica.AAC.4
MLLPPESKPDSKLIHKRLSLERMIIHDGGPLPDLPRASSTDPPTLPVKKARARTPTMLYATESPSTRSQRGRRGALSCVGHRPRPTVAFLGWSC